MAIDIWTGGRVPSHVSPKDDSHYMMSFVMAPVSPGGSERRVYQVLDPTAVSRTSSIGQVQRRQIARFLAEGIPLRDQVNALVELPFGTRQRQEGMTEEVQNYLHEVPPPTFYFNDPVVAKALGQTTGNIDEYLSNVVFGTLVQKREPTPEVERSWQRQLEGPTVERGPSGLPIPSPMFPTTRFGGEWIRSPEDYSVGDVGAAGVAGIRGVGLDPSGLPLPGTRQTLETPQQRSDRVASQLALARGGATVRTLQEALGATRLPPELRTGGQRVYGDVTYDPTGAPIYQTTRTDMPDFQSWIRGGRQATSPEFVESITQQQQVNAANAAAAAAKEAAKAAPVVSSAPGTQLNAAEFQAAWQAVINSGGEIPAQYLRYTPSTPAKMEISGQQIEYIEPGKPFPETTALLQLRSQIIGMGIQGRGEEFQQQEFEEQQRRAGVAEQQALATLTGQIGGGQRLAGFDASGAPLYEQLPAQETLQSLIQRANLTGTLGGYQTLPGQQFNLDRMLQTAGLTGYLDFTEDGKVKRVDTLPAQQLALETARLYGTPATPAKDTPTLAQQQFNLERALAAGRLPAVGDAPAGRTLEAQRLVGRLRGEPRVLLDAYNRPVLDDEGKQIYQTPLGDQTIEARLAESQMTLGTAASTLGIDRLAEEQRQFNERLQQERDLATGYTDFGQTVASRQQQAEAEMARQALEAQQARAALSAVTGMSQAAMQSPYGYGAFRALGGLGGGAGTAQQQITQQLAPIGFQFPTEAQAGTQVSPQAYFPSGVPTLGSLSQLPRSGQEQLQAVLGMTGTSPSQFGRLAGSITPTVTPQEQQTVTRRKPKVIGGAAI